MKRVFLKSMDWADAQARYDAGLSMRELQDVTGLSGSSIARAAASGLLKTRDTSTSLKLTLQRNPRDYSKARSKRPALTNYRSDCAFRFDLKLYPDEFDFDLVKRHGWYSPSNKHNNLSGVSRDHMVSVRYGFDNQVDSKLISHPANCKLMLHNDNVSKYIDCSITLEDLKQRIVAWDKRYSGG